jgi:hypothetical protein
MAVFINAILLIRLSMSPPLPLKRLLKISIYDFLAMFFVPVKSVQKINFGENIIYPARLCQNGFYIGDKANSV